MSDQVHFTADREAAAFARAEGIGQADANADERWKECALDAIEWCARYLDDFTSDDVWTILEDMPGAQTHEPSALGPCFLRASHAGVICKTGAMRASRLKRRHRDLLVWKGV